LLKTRLTGLLGLEYPIVSAPMVKMSGGQLAAAVSAAGALGTFGAVSPSRPVEPDYIYDQIRQIRDQTDRPFGVGFITHVLQRDPQNFDAVLAANVPVIALSFADPRPWLGRAKASGAATICQVQSLDAAHIAVEEGADVLAVQGNEAGGHTGRQNLLPFLVQVLEKFPNIPVIASGGIAHGRSLAAVLAAGADGAWLGTAFLAVEEASEIASVVKDQIVNSDGQDTIHTKIFDILNTHLYQGPPWPEEIAYRSRQNHFTAEWHGREDELRAQLDTVTPIYSEARQQANYDIAPSPYGEAAGFIRQVRSAGEVVRTLCEEAEHYLRQGVNCIAE
jgi:nitronate monooxygenase